jgi:tetratricopeptide (TPR) repeat protein
VRRLADLTARAGDADPLLRAGATRDLGACLDVLGRVDEAFAAYEESRAVFLACGDERGVANLDFRLGVVAALRGDVATARLLWEQCLQTFTRLDDSIGLIQSLGNLGALELDQGDVARGREMVERALELARGVGWRWWEARMSGSLAARLVERGELDEGERFARSYLAFAATTANRQEALHGLAILARAAAARGDEGRALALWASVQAVEDGPGRFGSFDREAYAAEMPPGPRPEPLPLDDAVALALR